MQIIFDNIETQLVEALNHTLGVSYRSDFCVGYFNLRGWKEVANNIDRWSGEADNRCRLLVGMQKLPQELLRDFFSLREEKQIDMPEAHKIKKELAQQFKDQLTVGIPTEADEIEFTSFDRLAYPIQHTSSRPVVIKSRDEIQVSPVAGRQ